VIALAPVLVGAVVGYLYADDLVSIIGIEAMGGLTGVGVGRSSGSC
jgi:hypothetical protein